MHNSCRLYKNFFIKNNAELSCHLWKDKHFYVFSLLLSVAEVPVSAGVDGSVSLTTLNEGVETFQATKKSRLHFLMLFSVHEPVCKEDKQGHHFFNAFFR